MGPPPLADGPPLRGCIADAPQGRRLGPVTMPPRFLPNQIETDYILGVRRDADDVRHVEVFRLHRQGGD